MATPPVPPPVLEGSAVEAAEGIAGGNGDKSKPASSPGDPPAPAERDALEESTAEIFSPYQCCSGTSKLSHKHPGEIAESGLLASVALPPLVYPADSLKPAADARALSNLQLEGCLYACQAHLKMLPNGTRMGFFLGDGAGVGKGRQIAGIILDNYARKRCKSVWMSLSSDLIVDAERDLRAVDCQVPIIAGCQALDACKASEVERGVLFTTYSTLTSSGGKRRRTRLQQIIDWCGGPEFDGVIVFDEAHKAKHFSTDTRRKESTKVSMCVIAIQDAMPLARIVYSSATGVTEVENLAYCTRLGLWGEGTHFSSFKDFKNGVEKRGIGALEMLAMELKGAGMYVSRGLSWKGAIFETIKCKLNEPTVKDIDAACQFWKNLNEKLNAAADLTGARGLCSRTVCLGGDGDFLESESRGDPEEMESASPGRERDAESAGEPQQCHHFCLPGPAYWGALQRFFRELATAAKVPFVVSEVKAALENGHSVVIGLQSTGEAGLQRALKDQGKGPGVSCASLFSVAYYQTRHFILTRFPTVKRPPDPPRVPTLEDIEATVAALGETLGPGEVAAFKKRLMDDRNAAMARSEALATLAGQEVVQECVAMKEELLRDLDSLALPPSPLDSLIDELGGPSQVAEMTGRRGRMVKQKDGSYSFEFRVSKDKSEASLNIEERKTFMEGTKRIAIISDAASTGVSLHAACGSGGSHRRRVHITLELAWSADKTIQQLGRSHRSHQQSAPIYKLLVTDLGGESRFVSAVCRRLQSLGALTKGDRRAASGCDFSGFDFENKLGLRALQTMLLNLECLASGVSMEDVEAPRGMDEKNLMELIKDCFGSLDLDPRSVTVSRFLNRIQALTVMKQNLLFSYLFATTEALIKEGRANGTYIDAVADLRASSIVSKCPPKKVARDELRGTVTSIVSLQFDRGVSFEASKNMHRNAIQELGPEKAEGTGFYVSYHREKGTSEQYVLLAVPSILNPYIMTITRPNTGSRTMPKSDLLKMYKPVKNHKMLEKAEELWKFWFKEGAQPRSQNIGARFTHVALVCGSILPVLPTMESVIKKHEKILHTSQRTLRVYRVQLDDGQRYVGIRFPPELVEVLSSECFAKPPLEANSSKHIHDVTPLNIKTWKEATGDRTRRWRRTSWPSSDTKKKREKDDDGDTFDAPLNPLDSKLSSIFADFGHILSDFNTPACVSDPVQDAEDDSAAPVSTATTTVKEDKSSVENSSRPVKRMRHGTKGDKEYDAAAATTDAVDGGVRVTGESTSCPAGQGIKSEKPVVVIDLTL